MLFARKCLLMCTLLFLHSFLCASVANFPSTTHNCGCFNDNRERQPGSWTLKLWKIVASGGRGETAVTVVILVITLLNIIVYKLGQLQETYDREQEEKPPPMSSEHLCRRFSLTEIRTATNGFDQTSVVGKGGFGKVYKGVIDNGTTTVAIKRLDCGSRQGASEFWTEIKMLSKFRHSHLVSLIGYCDDCDEMIVVYEYVSGGDLGERLYKTDGLTKKSPLTWVERLKICIGAARALDYLHTGTGVRHRIIHRDVKSSNILLDEHLAAKVSDLGVSKIGPADQPCTHVSTDVKGSFGYFDPNYFITHRLTRKSDVYGFGVVLLEVLCGRPAVDLSLKDDECGLVWWAQQCIREEALNHIIDPSLVGLMPNCRRVRWQILPDCLKAYIAIADKCLKSRPQERPTMAEVVVGLEAVLAQQERPHSFLTDTKTVDCNPYDDRERTSSYTKSAKNMSLSRMLRQMLPVKTSVKSARSHEKPQGKKKTSNKRFLPSTLSIKDGESNKWGNAFQEVVSDGKTAAPPLKIFSYAVIKSATRNFSQDMVVGEGAFGQVFMGWVEQETYAPSKVGAGIAVGVKKLSNNSAQGLEEWQAEVNILGRFRHPNLVRLLGYCGEDKGLLLVYEFMQKGSLDNYILKKGFIDPLPWATRLKILMGAARGLAFLHTPQNQIIYRDLKSSNILLDRDFNAKLADFGLAINGPTNTDMHHSEKVMGTYGYAAPEYVATGHLNGKNDIYAFGVVLLETLTGLRVIDNTRPENEQNLVEWATPLLRSKKQVKTIVDPTLGHDYPPEAAVHYAALVLKCTQLEPRKRPPIEQVLQSLEQINGIIMKHLQ